MSGRPRLRPGQWSTIKFSTGRVQGQVTARARFCDHSGVMRDWNASGRTKTQAQAALVAKFEKGYGDVTGAATGIDGNTTVDALYAFWWDEVTVNRAGYAKAYSPSTLTSYEGVYRLHLKDALGRLKIGDLAVSRLDAHIKSLMPKSLHNAKNARTILKLMFDVAVRHDARDDGQNPVTKTIHVPKKEHEINIIEMDRIEALRNAVRQHDALPRRGPKAQNPLSDLFDVLFLGLRIGEALGLRWSDVDFAFQTRNGIKTAITINGTLVETTGKGVYYQPKPKTRAGTREIIVPAFVSETLMRRRVNSPAKNHHGSVFVTTTGSWVSPNNMRRTWRSFREKAGFPDVTPHTLRRTTATLVDREVGSTEASRLLGHANDSVTREHYIKRPKLAPDLSEVLEQFR